MILLLGLCLDDAWAARRECLAAIRVGGADLPSTATVRCTDGDPTCDDDGAADGECTVQIRLCFVAEGCGDTAVETLRLRGSLSATLTPATDALALPIAEPSTCTDPVTVTTSLDGRRRRARSLKVAARAVAARDGDRVRLVCERHDEAGRALVVTTDFETGVLARANVRAPHRPRTSRTPIHADALLRVRGDVVAIVNRFLADNIQLLDPHRGYRTRLQCSTGPGSNPHDLAVVDAHKAYVTRYDRDALWIVDPSATGCGAFQIGTIDLGALADADGLPEMSQLAVAAGRVFVTLQRLDRTRGFAPTGTSLLAVIDPATDAVTDTVALAGSNAFGDASGLVLDDAGRLLVAQAGDIFRTGDGGIEAIDPMTLGSDGFIVTEDALGGSVTDFAIAGPRKGYAVVIDAALRNLLVAFDPATGKRLGTVVSSSTFMPDVTMAPTGDVWLATRGGIRVIDPGTDEVVRRFSFGLPPFSIGFVR